MTIDEILTRFIEEGAKNNLLSFLNQYVQGSAYILTKGKTRQQKEIDTIQTYQILYFVICTSLH